MIDLSKLTEAVKAVAGIAAQRDQAVTDRDRAYAAIKSAQADVDALTASLLAAATSPAEAVGLAAVSAALDHDAVDAAIAEMAAKTK